MTIQSKLKSLPAEGLTISNSCDVFHDWLRFCNENGLDSPEFLVPVLKRDITLTEFEFLSRSPTMSHADIQSRMTQVGAWDYTLNLSGVETREIDDVTRPEWTFHRFRVDLINQTLFRLFGDKMSNYDVLDIACHCGIFSLDMAARGARSVHGIDLRSKSIEQANFLKDLYGVENCQFEVGDAEQLPDNDYDIILNLGLLYHVTFPIQLLQHCYDHCRVACVVDTNVYNFPNAAFHLVAGKDTNLSSEGKSHAELLPTYRGLVLAMKAVGFEHVYELLDEDQASRDILNFSTFNRRVLVGFKELPPNLSQD